MWWRHAQDLGPAAFPPTGARLREPRQVRPGMCRSRGEGSPRQDFLTVLRGGRADWPQRAWGEQHTPFPPSGRFNLTRLLLLMLLRARVPYPCGRPAPSAATLLLFLLLSRTARERCIFGSLYLPVFCQGFGVI